MLPLLLLFFFWCVHAISIWLACNSCTLVVREMRYLSRFVRRWPVECLYVCAHINEYLSNGVEEDEPHHGERVYGKFNYLNYHISWYENLKWMMLFDGVCHWAYFGPAFAHTHFTAATGIDLSSVERERKKTTRQFLWVVQASVWPIVRLHLHSVHYLYMLMSEPHTHIQTLIRARKKKTRTSAYNATMPCINLEQSNKTSLLFAISAKNKME